MKRSLRPLIVLPEHADVDHFSAAFGLTQAMQKMDKQPVIVSVAKVPKSLNILGSMHAVHADIPSLHDLTIALDMDAAEMHEIKHEILNGKIHIHVTPKTGMWKPEHIDVRPSSYRYDLLICIGSPDLESCGKIFHDHPNFFFETPIINIDHSTANEHFGHINVVDVTATSCAEVCHSLIHAINPDLIDADMATHFLAGMIAKTRSFKTRNVTPKTLDVASHLLESGARREEIIHHLYRTRSVATLRLWGRALARLKSDPERKIVWTLLSQQDFLHAGAAEGDLPEVIDELIATTPEAESVLLLYENANHHVCAILRTHPPMHATHLMHSFAATGSSEEAHICLTEMNLIEAERKILEEIKK